MEAGADVAVFELLHELIALDRQRVDVHERRVEMPRVFVRVRDRFRQQQSVATFKSVLILRRRARAFRL